ncbi:MAG: hypothetical protein PWQ46_577 [Methanomicrobiaceae archaeon]|nr:hypothetical protein [Methanomicrobiaceae archaeon]
MIGSGAAGSRVRHRLRDYGHHEALCESPVAGVALVEGIKDERERVAVTEDGTGTLASLYSSWAGSPAFCFLFGLSRGSYIALSSGQRWAGRPHCPDH